jgi:hypothetical protein
VRNDQAAHLVEGDEFRPGRDYGLTEADCRRAAFVSLERRRIEFVASTSNPDGRAGCAKIHNRNAEPVALTARI